MKRFLIIFGTLFVLAGATFLLQNSSNSSEKEEAPDSAQVVAKKDEEQKPKHKTITPEEAKKLMNDGEDFTLIDVRTEEEFAEVSIESAILIPNYELEARAKSELKDKSARILIYCQSGGRSAVSAKLLVDLGYTNVYDMGGIAAWQALENAQ